MARSNFNRIKIHLNIGTIGHVDHRKTTLTSAISTTLAFCSPECICSKLEEIDSAPEERKRGITINTAHIEYETLLRHYSHVDCPGHADYVKNMITGAAQMDLAILVVAGTDGIMPQTIEHVLLSRQVGVPNFAVFVNKKDAMDNEDQEEFLKYIKEEIVNLLIKYDYSNEDLPYVEGSALKALQSLDKNSTILEQGFDKWVDSIFDLMDQIDFSLAEPERDLDKPFLLAVEKVLSISGRGTVTTGSVERGSINVGESVDVVGCGIDGQEILATTVTGIEMFRKSLSKGIAGDNVGLLLRGVDKSQIKRGAIVVPTGKGRTASRFEAEVYFLTSDEGGRSTGVQPGYRPQFFIRTTDITGNIEFINPKEQPNSLSRELSLFVMPGEQVNLTVGLIRNTAMETGMRFAIREGGKTVGSGLVIKVL